MTMCDMVVQVTEGDHVMGNQGHMRGHSHEVIHMCGVWGDVSHIAAVLGGNVGVVVQHLDSRGPVAIEVLYICVWESVQICEVIDTHLLAPYKPGPTPPSPTPAP